MAASAHHASALRNRAFICGKIKETLGANAKGGLALEVGSGTGAHLEMFCFEFPDMQWQPTEYVPPPVPPGADVWSAFGKIRGSTDSATVARDELQLINAVGSDVFKNALPALPLDLTAPYEAWHPEIRSREGRFTLVHCGNVLHVAPENATHGLLVGASRLLKEGGWLTLYGPFKRLGKFTTPSNAEFDSKLRATNPAFGYRDLDEIIALAANMQLALVGVSDHVEANNFFTVFSKRSLRSL